MSGGGLTDALPTRIEHHHYHHVQHESAGLIGPNPIIGFFFGPRGELKIDLRVLSDGQLKKQYNKFNMELKQLVLDMEKKKVGVKVCAENSEMSATNMENVRERLQIVVVRINTEFTRRKNSDSDADPDLID
jgi:hypothetical protein